MKKRLLAIVLSLIFVFQAFQVAAFAAPSMSPTVITYESTSEGFSDSDAQISTFEVGAEIVNFEFRLQLDLPVSDEGIEKLKNSFIASLSTEDGTVHSHVTFSGMTDKTLVYQAADVEPGEYILKLNAEYFFQDFEQPVTIKDGFKTTLVFSDSYSSYRGDDKNSPGVFPIGDVNGDGLIDENDSKAILDNIGEKATMVVVTDVDGKAVEKEEINPAYKRIYDLNFDDVVDIGDLGILVHNMNQSMREATPIETVLSSKVSVAETQAAAVPQGERKLDTIMEESEEVISLAPAKAQEAISEENPIAIEMNFSEETKVEGMVITAPAESGPKAGVIEIETFDPNNPNAEGQKIEVTIIEEGEPSVNEPSVNYVAPVFSTKSKAAAVTTATAVRKADGSIVIDLGKQVAIKKVTIVVTATAASTNLTEIAKVEFLNNMESRIPEPEMNIPQEISVTGMGDTLTVKWDSEVNVTGYEVAVSAVDNKGVKYAERTYKAGVNQIQISSFKGGVKDKVTPLWTYFIRVKSVNGSWSSPYSEAISHYQLAGKAPDAPDNVTVNGKFRQLDVSWKDMPGTEKYTLEYRVKDTGEYIVVNDIRTNSYKITGLLDDTTYQVRVCGWNTDSKGNPRKGPYSLPAIGKTTVEFPQFSKFGMLSRDDITKVSCFANANPGGPGGIDLSQYPNNDWTQEYVIDGDYTTFMHTNKGYPHGVIVELKEEIELKEIYVTNRLEDAYRDGTGYSQVILEVWDANGTYRKIERPIISVTPLHPTVKNTMKFTLSYPVKAKKIKFSLSKYGAGVVTISEINYFKYDPIEEEINALFADEMHISLVDGVTEEMISALEAKARLKDTVWDEENPKKDIYLSELAYARDLLVNAGRIGGTVEVKSDITKGNVTQIDFAGGLSGYQPLGYVAQSGKKINVYVGQKNKKVGDATAVRLVVAQYHPESAAWKSGEIALYQGKNEITVPEIASLDFEKGGSLYIVHTNPAGVAKEPVSVRVSGATKIPVLDLHRTIGTDRESVNEAAWKETIGTYIDELLTYTSALSANHEAHKESVGGYDYGKGANCFLNSTEISLDNVLISVPASQILAGLGGASAGHETLVNKMFNTSVAMNQMLELFYKERGFNPAVANGYHGIPTARFNIRYHRMFAGAFMYAGGLHLGIEWDSVPTLAKGNPIVTDENGKRIGGNMFGWGIAHELGHNADASNMSYAEVTNNIWSQFEKTWDTEGTSRVPYEAVYKHVTSGTVGKPGNVFAQLGMYWQLHLAYDQNYTHYDYYKDGGFTTENYQNMYNNEFFARFYAIRRQGALAPQSGLANGNTDQNIMRVACAAANKDLTDFFRAWGMDIDATTAAYAAKYPKEERKIQYLNDAAREYVLAHKDEEAYKMTSTTVNAELVQGTGTDARKVTIKISLPAEARPDAILGYEIIRNGKPAAFIQPAKAEDGTYEAVTVYTDTVESINNRVMDYAVVAYDKYLNYTETAVLDTIKIRHEGVLPTANWSATTNTVSNAGVLTVYDGTKIVEGEDYKDVTTGATVTYSKNMDIRYLDKDTGELLRSVSAASLIFDGDGTTGYEGTATSTAQITIDLGGKQDITAIAFLGGSTIPWKFALEYSINGGASFTRISGFESGTSVNGYPTLFFADGNNIKSYKATTIRITAPNNVKTLGIKEIALLSPSGDNVDIGISTLDEATGIETWNTENAIGLLGEDYILDAATGEKIPAGSFIVTGKYTGNAAYNVVKLYNQDHIMHDDSEENRLGSIVNGYQVFFADMPDTGSIVNVKDGFWVYWLEPLGNGQFGLIGAGENGEDIVVELPTKVYAELYRVNNALTLAGERLVSDTFTVDVPEVLPTITLQNSAE